MSITPSSHADQIDPELKNLLEQAEFHMEAGDYKRAVDEAKKACEDFCESPLPHHALSVVYLRLLKSDIEHLEIWEDICDDEAYYDAAIGAAKAAIDVDEEFVPARNNLAMLFASRGWWKEALQQWEISLSIDSDQSHIRQEMIAARKHIE